MSVSLCPLITPDGAYPTPPAPKDPARLAYSFTVPGEPRSAGVARSSVRTALQAHGLGNLVEPATQIMGELVACGGRFAPGQDLYYSLCWRDGILRLVNWDPHHSHSNPDLAATCTSRRKRMLMLVACVVHECGGTWGIADPKPASEGTTVWANLPQAGAVAYTARRD
ncbi:ATP-binding protein [Streptomyces sp. NPDC046215]|uniref:ATP-binding protein n=1 Tax=Streptomyces stramineus TaxID=173861 RepID=A0ABN0ZUR7_9ACTN